MRLGIGRTAEIPKVRYWTRWGRLGAGLGGSGRDPWGRAQ